MAACGAKWVKISKTYKIDYVRFMRMMGCEKLSFHVRRDYNTTDAGCARKSSACIHSR